MKGILGIDHIGYAVIDMGAARRVFSVLGYGFSEEVIDDRRNVTVCMAENVHGGVKVELLAPVPGRRTPIDGYLKAMGSTPYHLCYKVDDMEMSVARLQETGFTLLCEPALSVPLGGDVCFLYSMEIGMIELIEHRIEKPACTVDAI